MEGKAAVAIFHETMLLQGFVSSSWTVESTVALGIFVPGFRLTEKSQQRYAMLMVGNRTRKLTKPHG